MKNSFLLAGIAALMLSACNNKPAQELTLSGLNPVNFQTEVNNAKTDLYTLKNKSGMEVCITNFGGRIEANPIDETTLELPRISPDGDENFPGNVTAKVLFKLTDDNAIDIKYSATTDKKTVINMTNHSYFNLSGNPSKAATDHILYVNADNYTPVDSTFMTTGEIVTVKDTPMDFTTPKTIGQDITNFDFVQLKNGNGYDHNWVLNTNGDIAQLAAKLTSPESGITLEVYTNEPGIQVYTGNFLDGTVTGKKGITYNQRASVCLETQHYPDSPNKPEWPSVVLEPGQTYNSECIFKFSVEK